MSKAIDLEDKKAFAETIKSGPTLVDFWATWCGPCKTMSPVVEAIAEKYEGRLTVGKLCLDSGDGAFLAGAYVVRSIPTLILFIDGRPVSSITGSVPAAKVEAMLTEAGIST